MITNFAEGFLLGSYIVGAVVGFVSLGFACLAIVTVGNYLLGFVSGAVQEFIAILKGQ